jgi:hypothetical protein
MAIQIDSNRLMYSEGCRYDVINVEAVYSICRDGEAARFEPFKHCSNRRLLFHGTPQNHVIGILSQVNSSFLRV